MASWRRRRKQKCKATLMRHRIDYDYERLDKHLHLYLEDVAGQSREDD